MHIKSRNIAFGGMMMALTVLCFYLSSWIEFSTLCFLALAAVFVGIICKSSGTGFAGGFMLGCFLLGLLLAPNKFYCFTYLAFAFYILIAETMHGRVLTGKSTMKACWLVKALAYHGICLVTFLGAWLLFGVNGLFSPTELQWLQKLPVVTAIGVLVFAEAFWLLYDKAYRQLMARWIRRKIGDSF